MAAPRRFWMVKGSGPASYVHHSQSSAEAEAERLARCNPGECFFVLEAVAAHIRHDVRRIVLSDADAIDEDELPF